MKKPQLTARTIRSLLSVVLVLVVVAIVGGFYWGLDEIKKFALEVSQVTETASASSGQTDELQRLKRIVADRDTLTAKSGLLFTTSADYQTRALSDLQKYADQTGITIVNTGSSPQTNTPEDRRDISISIGSPVEYANLLRFLNAVETNLPKMTIVKITLGRSDASSTQVTVSDLVIGISVR